MLALYTDRQWLWGAAGFYLAGFLVGTVSLLRRGRPSGVLVYALLAAGYLLQIFGLTVRGRAVGGCPLGNPFEIIQFTAWSLLSLYLVVGVTFRSSLLGYLTAVLATALTVISLAQPAWDAARRAHLFGNNPWIEFHAALALFSYGVFALLSLTSLLFLLRIHSLQSKNLGGWFSFLPSVIDLDEIGVRLLAVGVFLLAASLGVGSIYWARDMASVGAAHFLTLSVWAAYATILGLRLRGYLIAKRFAWSCVVLFAIALVSLAMVDSRNRAPAISSRATFHRP